MRFSMEFRNNFPQNLRVRFMKYVNTIHRWPFDNEELYWHAWTEEERHCLEYIYERHKKGVLVRGDALAIEFDSLGGKADFIPRLPRMSISLAERYRGFRFTDMSIKDTDIRDKQLRMSLLSWTVTYYRLRNLSDLIKTYCEDVLDESEGLNTPGQLYRVWPEIASVMPSRYAGRVMNQKLKSSLPAPFLERTSIEQFRSQPHFDEINNHFLAMSVIDIKPDENVPEIW